MVDLAKGHVAALDKLYGDDKLGCEAVNLGTGQGVSVLELVNGMGEATGKTHATRATLVIFQVRSRFECAYSQYVCFSRA